MIRHHPDDLLLAGLASATLPAGPAVVVAAHVEACPRCFERARTYDAVGGALLDAAEPATLRADALARTLDRIDAASPSAAAALFGADDRQEASLPPGVAWPRTLRGSAIEPWRRLGRHVRFSRVTLPGDADANVYAVRVPSGRGLPVHRHRGGEVTLVLHGAFEVDGERFAAGDFDVADERDHHRPAVAGDEECICLIAVDGRVAFDGPVARAVGSWLRM